MLLHAGVAKVVTGSAGKNLQPSRSVKFEGSAATTRTEQAKTPTTSSRRNRREPKAKPQTAQSISRFDSLAILYDNARDEVRWSAHQFSPRVICPCASNCAPLLAATVPTT